MNSSGNYQVSYAQPFLRSLKELKEGHYRKNEKGKAELEELIIEFRKLLSYEPRPPIEIARQYNDAIQKIDKQQFNSKEYLPHWDFRKLYFYCPQLQKVARMGRLMYIIDDKAALVRFTYIYTHQRYPDRPPDGVMNDIFKKLKAEEGG